MGNIKAFLTINRKEAGYRPVVDRVTDYSEVEQTLNSEDRMLQASRCMECGVAFCHWACPLGNLIPEWQDLLCKGKWNEAYGLLHKKNNFPEFTGRVCPAMCEKSCVLNQEHQPLTIRENEAAITEHAFLEGFIKANPPKMRTGKCVAVIGSGPAGLAVADQLNQKGHSVTVFEKDEYIGGLLRLGIPDFKLNKRIIERRVDLMTAEGIVFTTGVEVGAQIAVEELLTRFDAVCLAIGAGTPRNLMVEGRNLKGIHFALDFLKQQNRTVSGQQIAEKLHIDARDKNVLVIGGGDTGSDCVGTAIRQRAKHVRQIEILPKPPEVTNPETPWPLYPNILKTSSSHLEGGERQWAMTTKRFIGEAGKVAQVEIAQVEWSRNDKGAFTMHETDKCEIVEADLVLLAMGFTQPVHEGLLDSLGVKYDARGNVETLRPGETSVPKIFVAGDANTGASLVVRAIYSGRVTAERIDRFLKNQDCKNQEPR